MGFSIGNLNLGNITSIFSGGSGGNAVDAVKDGLSLLSGGQGDSTLFSKIGETLSNFKGKVNDGLENFKSSELFSNASNTLLTMAQNFDNLEIPDKIQEAFGNLRNKIVETGIVGKVAGGALNIMYKIGGMMPSPIKDVVGAMSSVVTPQAVETIINKSLTHIETQFFDQIEGNPDYQNLRKEVLETVSAENIVRVSKHLFDTSLDVGIAVTENGGTLADAKAAIEKHVAEYQADTNIEHIKEAAPYVMGTLGAVVDGTVDSAMAIAQDGDIQSQVQQAVSNAPGAMMTAGQAIFTSLQGLGSFLPK